MLLGKFFTIAADRRVAPLSFLLWGLAIVLAIGGTVFSMVAGRNAALATSIMAEKGAALIASLEGGVRFGKRSPAGLRLQLFLEELAARRDVAFIALAMPDGTIVAHSNPRRIGEILSTTGREILPEEIERLRPGHNLSWTIMDMEGEPAFVVYRVFQPPHDDVDAANQTTPLPDARADAPEYAPPPGSGLEPFVFVGLRLSGLKSAEHRDERNLLFISAAMLAAGVLVFGIWYALQRVHASRRSQRVAEALAEVLAVSLPDGLLLFDHKGNLTRLNDVALHLLGFSSEAEPTLPEQVAAQLQGRGLDPLPAPLADLVSTLIQGDSLADTEIRLEQDGKTRFLEVRGGHVEDPQEGRIGSLIILRDLTLMRRLENEVRRREKLAAVGNLAAGVAHELRNPLSSIKGYATYFSGRFPEGSEEREAALVMVQEADRLNRAITDLIGLSRPTDLRGRSTDMVRLAEDSLRLIRQEAAGRHIRVHLEHDDLPPIAVDPDRIRQAILNLCLNALDAMPQGGDLTLRLANDEESAHLVLEVIDSGCGIPQDQLPFIFDPYFTTKGHGTGLGLPTVHKIIEAHGGDITVNSTPGSGSLFRLRLPYNGLHTEPSEALDS